MALLSYFGIFVQFSNLSYILPSEYYGNKKFWELFIAILGSLQHKFYGHLDCLNRKFIGGGTFWRVWWYFLQSDCSPIGYIPHGICWMRFLFSNSLSWDATALGVLLDELLHPLHWGMIDEHFEIVSLYSRFITDLWDGHVQRNMKMSNGITSSPWACSCLTEVPIAMYPHNTHAPGAPCHL